MHHSVVSKATVCIIAGKVDVLIRLLKTEVRGQGWGGEEDETRTIRYGILHQCSHIQ